MDDREERFTVTGIRYGPPVFGKTKRESQGQKQKELQVNTDFVASDKKVTDSVIDKLNKDIAVGNVLAITSLDHVQHEVDNCANNNWTQANRGEILGLYVRGSKVNRRGRPKLGVLHPSPYKKDTKPKSRSVGVIFRNTNAEGSNHGKAGEPSNVEISEEQEPALGLASNDDVRHFPYWGSNYRPLLIKLEYITMRRQGGRPSRPSRFHIEEMWIKFSECEDIISSSWSAAGRAGVMGTVQKKISTCAANLSKWSHHKFGGNQGRIDRLNRELDTHLHGRVIPDKRLWFNRNNIVFGSFGWDAADIVIWTGNFASEFQLANEVTHKEILSQQPVWRPPQVGSFKINCDASFQLRSGKAGVGVIIRDHRGLVVAAKASPVFGCSSVELLDAQACLEGLQLALDIGISGVVLESDAAGVIKLFSDHIVPRTEMGAIMTDCLALTNLVGVVSTVAVRRGANSVVHSLAQLALSLEGPVVWLEELPPDIARLVCLDSRPPFCSV
ncbi:hypothetical protein Q3G72_026726 [Acer saccharum]|nr:hypothetical protein Q3G72_026726 [Acer saccharum]